MRERFKEHSCSLLTYSFIAVMTDPATIAFVLLPTQCWNWVSSPNLSNWVLAGVGILGVLVAVWTLLVIRRQTIATRIAAMAAKESAESLQNIERAWILLGEFNEERHNYRRDGIDILLNFHNYGKTPAWVLETSFRFANISDSEYRAALNYEPAFLSKHADPVPPGKPLPTIRRPLELSEYLVGRPNQGNLLFFGFIRYRDVFGKVRETRVRMKFQRNQEDLIQDRPGQWIYDGPPDANRHT